MSAPDPNNPFAAPPADQTAGAPSTSAVPSVSGIDYLRSYRYVFDNPNWIMNVLCGFLCIASTMLIPILGQLIFIGYQFEVIDALLASRGARYPDFDINRFVNYLGRSIWPFLINFVVGLILVPVISVAISVPVALLVGLAATAGRDWAGVVMLIGIPLLLLIILPLSIAFAMVLIPMMFRAGMAQNLGEGFNFAWVADYVKRVWKELFLAMLFLVLSAMVLVAVGAVLCILPLFAAAALVMLAQAHLMYQLYSLYLSRGGQPIPLPAMTSAMPPQPMAPPG